MRKSYLFFFTALLIFSACLMPVSSFAAPEDPGPPPPAGLFGMPTHLFMMPGDSINIPVEFYASVPPDSQVSSIAFTIKSSTPDFSFIGFDTLKTFLHGWTFLTTTGGDSIRVEATAPSGVFFEKPEGPPENLFNFGGTAAVSFSEGDSLELKIQNVNLVLHGLTVAIPDSDFSFTKIFLGAPPPPPDGGKHGLFRLTETAAEPDSHFTIEFLLNEPVPADSQLSRIRGKLKSVPPHLMWASTGHDLAPAISGWTLTTTGGTDSLIFDLEAPTGEFLSHSDSTAPLLLVKFHGEINGDAPPGYLTIFPKDFFLTTKGTEGPLPNDAINPGEVIVITDGDPPPPPSGDKSPFAFSETYAEPDSHFAISFGLIEPVSPDSQISRIRGTFRAFPPNLMWGDEAAHYLPPELSGWTFTSTGGGTDSVTFDLTAPTGTFLSWDGSGDHLLLVKFFGEVFADAPFGQIDVMPEEFFVTAFGVEHPLGYEEIHPGKIHIGDGGPFPGGGEMFAFEETEAEPDKPFSLGFGLIEDVSADEQISRIRGTLKSMPPDVIWDAAANELGPELSDWTLDVTGMGTDSITFDLVAPSGIFLEFSGGDEPLFLAKFSGMVRAEASHGEITLMPKNFFITEAGVEEQLEDWEIKPGRIFVVHDGGPPPPPPPPPTATTEGRTNLGLYGGTVMDMAFDEVSGLLFAAVAAPQSVFTSADSGLTWYAAFPEDSLEFVYNGQLRGFGGRALQVQSSNGYTYARNSQEAGTLTGSQVTEDGSNWRTLIDGYLINQLVQAEFGGSVHGPFAIQQLSTYGSNALVSSNNLVFRTTNAGGSWDISVVPNAASLSSTMTINILEICGNDPNGASFYVGLGNGWHSSVTDLYRTEDGINFTEIFITSGPDTAEGYMGLTAHPVNSDTLWVSVMDQFNPSLNGIWRSEDAGDSWTKVFEASGGFIVPSVTIYEDSKYSGPDNVRLFLVGENKYSDDLGDSWSDFTPGNDPYVQRVSNANAGLGHIPESDIYFSQGDGSPARSTDGLEGNYLFDPTGIEGITIWDIAQIPGDMDKVYLATSVGIAYTSVFTDTSIAETAKWVEPYGNYPINPNGGGNTGFTAIEIDPHNTEHIIAANGNGIFVTDNGGFDNESWSSIQYDNVSGLDDPTFKSQGGTVNQITFITSDSVIAALSCQRVQYGALILSTDGGATWSVLTSAGNHSYKSVIAAWDRTNTSMVLFASGGSVTNDPTGVTVIDSGAVYKSIDWGLTWDRTALAPNGTFNPAPFPLPILEIAVKPGSQDTLYMACGDNLSNAIVRTFDGGHTLESISMEAIGPREGAFEAVAINKNHPDSIYFAIRRDILVYDAVNDNATTLFRGYPGELTHTLLYDELTMGSSSGFYAVTAPENPGTTTSVNDNSGQVPTTLRLSQNYPNPFNPSTNISFNLPFDAKVKLEIFNIIGQRVESLLAGNRKAGTHTLQWQPDKLASGIYIYRLEVLYNEGKKQILSKKLMFLK